MKIGLLQVELKVPGSMSLKDKRRVVRSIRAKLHREHLVSVAEVGAQSTWNVAIIGIALVSADGPYIHSVLENIIRKLGSHPEAVVENYMLDVVDVDQLRSGAEDEDGSPLWTPEERRDDNLESPPAPASALLTPTPTADSGSAAPARPSAPIRPPQ